ncbi:hypothetical protein ACS0TY_021252 [Phlomoides rotata]
MSSLDVARAELGLAVLYLNKAEARDKICRAIQYGSKFLAVASGQRPSFTASPTTPAISSLYKLSNKPSLPATTTSPG